MGAIGTLPTWARARGFSPNAIFNAVALMNAGAAIGRVCVGAVSDRFGRFNVMVVTVLFGVLMTFGMWLNIGDGDLDCILYIFMPHFGFGCGAVMSMMPNLVSQYVVPRSWLEIRRCADVYVQTGTDRQSWCLLRDKFHGRFRCVGTPRHHGHFNEGHLTVFVVLSSAFRHQPRSWKR
jgi:hypothetical protein